MKGVSVSEAGAPLTVVSDLERPRPGPNEIFVRSLVVGINPMENFMQQGLLVESWPTVLGCEAAGVVTEIGEDVSGFGVGDRVFGVVKVGFGAYMAFQEFFLMESETAFRTPDNVSDDQAATLGVAFLTASLGVVTGLHLELPSPATSIPAKEAWIVILGGASAVGQAAIQIAKLNALKVVATCSPSNNELVQNLGADVALNYRLPLHEQVGTIGKITGGNFFQVFDPSAQSSSTAFETLLKVSKRETEEEKLFATTDDWTDMALAYGIDTYRVHLGKIDHSGSGDALADQGAKW
ncbi:related to oxidoreductase [Phialocephala subalpina]|uniref:Related to oxidoreductase n=1 Tax=Phialocephala subalpina TaxID=576137 RepID=A0A1L7XJP5_9HELO|nr:related to oxidoreductase [Phialocephala subalpina]